MVFDVGGKPLFGRGSRCGLILPSALQGTNTAAPCSRPVRRSASASLARSSG